jgi:hypothetical protein
MTKSRSSCVPSEVDLKLRLGICRLLERKYSPRFGSRSKFLTAGVVNWIMLEPPGNDETAKFLETNETLVRREAENLHLDADVALAISVLYTFSLIWLGPTNPERSKNIVERATDLNILIQSAKELYPTDDAAQFLAFIDEYADRLLAA